MSSHRPIEPLDHLGDFTTTLRVIPISALALDIGAVAAVVFAALLRLIGLFTNLFFFPLPRDTISARS